MTILWDQINVWAALVAGLAAMVIGMAWYGGPLGKLWVRLNGYSEDKVKQMQAARPPALFLGGMLVSYIVVGFVFAALAATLGVQTPLAGAMLGGLLWLGLAATLGFTAHLASDKHIGVYCLDASYQLVFLIVMGLIIGAWR